MEAAGHRKLQLLADALAEDYSRSVASFGCCHALNCLFPNLAYCCIAVSSPALDGTIVASGASTAEPGPTILRLHDPHGSAAGTALAIGKPLQANLLDGAGALLVPAWTDVQQMMASRPDATNLLCVPFGCHATEGAAHIEKHARAGGDAGALLLGFVSLSCFDVRCSVVLAGLVQCLPSALACLAGDTLAFVSFVCTTPAGCHCGSLSDADSCEDGCRPASHSGSSDSGTSVPLRLLSEPASAPGENVEECAEKKESPGLCHGKAGPSCWRGPAIEQWGSASRRRAMEGAAKSAGSMQGSGLALRSPRSGTFSKALLAQVFSEPRVSLQQHPVLLRFHSPMAEREYGVWMAKHYSKIDYISYLLLVAAIVIATFSQPLCLYKRTPCMVALGVIALLLLAALHLLSKPAYAGYRSYYVAAIRLYPVTFTSLAGITSYKANVVAGLSRWIFLWRMSGAEALFATSVGVLAGTQLHMLLQLAALGITAWSLPTMCLQGFPEVQTEMCIIKSAVFATAAGCLLPSALLRYVEQRSRSTFSRLLRTAASCHTNRDTQLF